MAWETAASVVALYMRRARRRRSSIASNASSRAAPSRSNKLTPIRSGSTELRTQPMVPPSATISRQRSERRISVRLPLKVRGRDASGLAFEEETSSENLCRNGAAFVTRFDVAIGSDLEIRIPLSQHVSRRLAPERLAGPGNGNRFTGPRFNESDFTTNRRAVHSHHSPPQAETLFSVQFPPPRFQRVFRSEPAP